jgi:hypothetical protein
VFNDSGQKAAGAAEAKTKFRINFYEKPVKIWLGRSGFIELY